jgi:hypothetical protein
MVKTETPDEGWSGVAARLGRHDDQERKEAQDSEGRKHPNRSAAPGSQPERWLAA